ncbi:mitochondrial ribosomal protein subunit-domain-containing protein [Multifurca ochricompacta]|uniref:Mitochondrial ribosomal protein subunit-domain-containing protein n=1 Tax=Multifurca ochricompacta TaxID=376703 RepID=A0AAD4MCI7_9AGAM|nr:mitochondrial ribosomal protein subunit-domain-containing protein [Multifurca ochricompacta]
MAAIAKAAILQPQSPSPFAALLRRSKFASYDPTIGQLYTTHDGNAHRGNWGFKRPLALRKRDKFITVEAVDSPEQQTEWTSRESEARFIQRWGEVATEPNVREAWERHYMNSRPVHQAELAKEDESGNIIDPAVQRQADESPSKRQYVASGPLVSAMGPRQFTRYLDKLRQQRPEFLSFLSEEATHARTDRVASQHHLIAPSAYEESALGSAEMVRRRFLQRQSHALYEDPNSCAIEQRPHRNGGLSYAHTSQLTHFFTTNEQPGRFIESQDSEGRPSVGVSIAGMAASLKTLTNHHETGSQFRVVDSVLKQAPKVVSARPRGLDGAIIEATVEDAVNLHMTRANPFPPGTRAYIAHAQRIVPLKGKRSMTTPKPKSQRKAVTETGTTTTKELLSTLRTIINTLPSSKDQES